MCTGDAAAEVQSKARAGTATNRPLARSHISKEQRQAEQSQTEQEELFGKDQHWAILLKDALDNTDTPATLEEALLQMSAVVFETLKDAAGTPYTLEDTQTELRKYAADCVQCMEERLPDMEENNHPGITLKLQNAACIHNYTRERTDRDIHIACYKIMSNVLHDVVNRQQGDQVSDTVRQVLPYAKLLDESLQTLPEFYHCRGLEVWRGVRWVFPNPTAYNPKQYFFRGRRMWWFECRSTSEVRSEAEHFAGAGETTDDGQPCPGTVFKVCATHAYKIAWFSQYPEEEEILFPMMSEFKVGDVELNWKSIGQPDIVQLRCPDTPHSSMLPIKPISVDDSVQSRQEVQSQHCFLKRQLGRASQCLMNMFRPDHADGRSV